MVDGLERLEETIAVQADVALIRQLTVSEEDLAAGRVDDELLDDDTRATGLYRICEQGLLNAAIHGHATECSIQVTLTPRDELVLHLTDNGVGLQGKPVQPGMGSTVISAWVESLGGQWALEPAASGMTLTATFPCA
jgi:signal transduction histidine kinase